MVGRRFTCACSHRIINVGKDHGFLLHRIDGRGQNRRGHSNNKLDVFVVEVLQNRRYVDDLSLCVSFTHLKVFALDKTQILESAEESLHASSGSGLGSEVNQANFEEASFGWRAKRSAPFVSRLCCNRGSAGFFSLHASFVNTHVGASNDVLWKLPKVF